MLRKIVQIDEEKCNGCGLCIDACHEAALKLIGGKAKLLSDNLCDGLGACLPDCPTGAITIVERAAAAFDETAVKRHIAHKATCSGTSFQCPGSRALLLKKAAAENVCSTPSASVSQLRQWPCQLQLVPVNAAYFDDAHLLVAADCTAYAYSNMHNDFMRNRVTVIGCPKLDSMNYTVKLTEILKAHKIKSITTVRMEVPCCAGIVNAVKAALTASGQVIPLRVVIIGADGAVREDCDF